MGRRIRWLGLVLVICFALVVVQLANIQFKKASALAHSPDNPVNRAPDYDNQRGRIFAADGTLLAQSVRVAPPGSARYQFERQYPTGALFSHIVGVCNQAVPTIGCVSGTEGYYSQALSLHKQSPQNLSQLLSPPPARTEDLWLTVDPKLQQDAIDALNGLPGANKDGAIVMIRPSDGSIVAMASTPGFDPSPLASPDAKTAIQWYSLYNQPDAEGFKPIYPMATYSTIAPGSTAKVITTAAIYNLDPALATYNFPVAPCLTNIPDTDKQICNDADTAAAAGPCGGTIVQMLPESCDPGYAKLGLLLGGDTLAQQAQLFGFNSRPPLDLGPNDPTHGFITQASQYPTAQQLANGSEPGVPGQAYSAFGQQDVATTALQNAMVAAAIANHGTIMVPHLMWKVTNSQGKVIETYQPTVWKQATSSQAASQVIPLMQGVATKGTAAGVFSASLNVAAKTGTAQVGSPTVTSVADWMIAFAPANNPQIAIAVVVPYQPLDTQGATVAGPIANEMLLDALG
ncbi:MAG: penicillin-binding transpeptidase domain-containing protein [Acidimicrobiales bacterium]